MSYKNPLKEREHALEEAYFQKQNRRLIEQMRVRREAAEQGTEPVELRMSTIVVATDFSTTAAHATDMAVDYAKKFGAKLVLVHAFELPLQASGIAGGYVPPANLMEEIRQAARERVKEAADEISATGVDCEGVALDAPSAIGIVNEAVDREADLIVMGTRGLTGLKHVALGSVADKVVRTAPCPVLTVPSA